MNTKKRKKRNHNVITKEQLCNALSKAGGMKTIAAQMLDKSPAWMSERCKDPEIIEHLRKVEDERLDKYEAALDKLMNDGNTTAIIFYLKTKGRGRGYIEHAPAEVVTTEKLAELREFFACVPKRERHPLSPYPLSQEPSAESESPQFGAPSIEKPLAATQNASANLDSLRGKIVRLETNFP